MEKIVLFKFLMNIFYTFITSTRTIRNNVYVGASFFYYFSYITAPHHFHSSLAARTEKKKPAWSIRTLRENSVPFFKNILLV